MGIIPYTLDRAKKAATVSAMFSLNALDGDVAITGGFNSANDGGGNEYVYSSASSATIDGIFVLPGFGGSLSFDASNVFNGTAGTGRWIAKDQTLINALQSGAVADGVAGATPSGTDNLGVFQRCANAASSNKVPFYIPEGTYRLGVDTGDGSETLAWYIGADSVIFGAGIGKTNLVLDKYLKPYAGTSAEKTRGPFIKNLSFRQTANPIIANMKFSDMTIHGMRAKTGDTELTGIYEYYSIMAFTGVDNILVERVEFLDSHADGFQLNNSHTVDAAVVPHKNIVVDNCRFENCLRGGTTAITGEDVRFSNNYYTGYGPGIHFENGSAANAAPLRGCLCINNVVNGVTGRPLWVAIAADSEYRRLKIINNRFENTTVTGFADPLFVIGGQDAEFVGNVVYNVSTDDQFMRIAGSNIRVADNQFIDCTVTDGAASAAKAFFEVLGETSTPCKHVIIRNTVKNCVGPGAADTNHRFINCKTLGGYQVPEGLVVADNTFEAKGWYYLIFGDYDEIQYTSNRFITPQGDADACYYGFYAADNSTAAILINNDWRGFRFAPIRSSSTRQAFLFANRAWDDTGTAVDIVAASSSLSKDAVFDITDGGIPFTATLETLFASNFATTTTADLEDDTAAINTTDKYQYKLAYNQTDGQLYFALGDNATSGWSSADGKSRLAPGNQFAGQQSQMPLEAAFLDTAFVIAAGPYSIPFDGTAAKVFFYTVGTANATLGLYEGTDSAPTTLVGASSEVAVTNDGWTEAVITGAIDRTKKYWIAIQTDSTISGLRNTENAATPGYRVDTNTYSAGTLPASFTNDSGETRECSAYFEYLPTALDEVKLVRIGERSADPADPPEGETVIWQSDGTGTGDDGDLMVKITAGGTTKTITLIDFSAS